MIVRPMFALALAVLLLSAAVPVFADIVLTEGTPIALGTTVVGGDVVVCEAVSPCSLTDPSTWSDVIDFYNPANGPFVADVTQDATFVEVFSDGVSGQGSLANFLANYTGPFPPAVLPAGSFVVEGSGGTVTFGSSDNPYTFTSPEPTTTPEPGTIILLGIGILGVLFTAKYWRRPTAVRLSAEAFC